jgi:hypothetical protein
MATTIPHEITAIPHVKQKDIPLVPADDTVSENGSVDEYATHVLANSTKTAFIDPGD